MRKLVLGLCALALAACSSSEPAKSETIVCTTGMIGDAVQQLMGKNANVKVLMGPGVDPHLYKATQGDIAALTDASAIVYNGLHLEGKMTDIFEKLARNKITIAMGDIVAAKRLLNSTDFDGAEDPHIWFDVELWSEAVERLAENLANKFPEQVDSIGIRMLAYQLKLKAVHNFCLNQTASLDSNERIMITAHDAFKYFGRAYGLEVRGLQGISTTAEFGLADVSDLVNYIVENKVKAIFTESSVSSKSIEAVIEGCAQRGHEVKLGGELFSDAMGAKDSPEGTYIGMVMYNMTTIVKALGK